MKSKLKKIIGLILVLSLISIYILPTKVFAAEANLSATSSEIEVGQTTTINVSTTSVETWNLKLTASGGSLSGTTETTDASDGATSKTLLSPTFSSSTAGTYTITLSGTIAGSDLNKMTVSKSIKITVKEKKQEQSPQTNNEGQTPGKGTNTNNIPQDAPKPQEQEKSRNYYLKSLSVSVSNGEVKLVQSNNESAGFNRGVEDYKVVFPDDYNYDEFSSIKVSASAEDSKAKVTGTGDITINEGDNTIEVKCTAENGSVKTYKVKVTKPIVIKKSELKLDSLVITKTNENNEKEEVELDNKFDKDIFEYKTDLESNIQSIAINLATSKVKDQDIIVKINGKEIKRDLDGKLEEEIIDLEDGANTIRITLVSPLDENVTTDYVVNANKEAEVLAVSADVKNGFSIKKEDIPKIVIAVILGIILILVITLIILIIINHKQTKNKKGSGENLENLNGEEEKDKIFNYDEEDTYLDEEKLEKLNEEYTKNIEDEVEETEKIDEDDDLEEIEETKEESKEVNEEEEENKEFFKNNKPKKGKHFN